MLLNKISQINKRVVNKRVVNKRVINIIDARGTFINKQNIGEKQWTSGYSYEQSTVCNNWLDNSEKKVTVSFFKGMSIV